MEDGLMEDALIEESAIGNGATTIAASARAESGKWDRLGSLASSACAIHCLVTPLLFLALPAFAKVWAHPASHALMALFVVPLALTVVIQGYRQHRRRWVLFAAIGGIAFILVGSALPYLPSDGASTTAIASAGETSSGPAASGVAVPEATTATCTECCPTVVTDESGESRLHWPPAALVTIAGSVLLVSSHLGNRRGCKGCRIE